MKPLPHLVPISQPQQVVEVRDLAKKDEHNLLNPVALIVKDKKTIGTTTLNVPGYPTVFLWLHSKEAGPFDTKEVVNLIESHVRMNGGQGIIAPVGESSPFVKVMEHLGYRDAGKFHIFVKDFYV